MKNLAPRILALALIGTVGLNAWLWTERSSLQRKLEVANYKLVEKSEQVSDEPVAAIESTGEQSANALVIEELGLQLNLPKRASKLKLNKSINTGETGKQLCIEDTPVAWWGISLADAGGADCLLRTLMFGALTFDYEAGRETGFSDIRGYSSSDGQFFYTGFNNAPIAYEATDVYEHEGSDGVSALIVQGRDYFEDGFGWAVSGTPGEGNVGAVINLEDNDFTALTIAVDTSVITESELLEMIDSITLLDDPR